MQTTVYQNPIPANSHSRTRPGRVVAILPRGEAIRNFVYTGGLDKIAEESELTVISVMPGEEIKNLLGARYPGVLELHASRDRWLTRFSRELLDTAHGRYLWSAAAQERWRLRNSEADTASLYVKRLLKKAVSYPFASRTGIGILSRAERAISRSLRTTNHYLEVFKRLRPSLVFNTSHVHSAVAIQAIEAAQWLGIPTATFLFSWDNLTSQGRIIPSYDYYFSWNESIREDLLRIYPSIRPEQVFVTGTPQFDFHFRAEFHWSRDEFCRRVGADPARPIILYSTGMANHMPGEPEVVEQIADQLKEIQEFGPPQLLVRIYPKDRTGRFDELRGRRPDILFPAVSWEPSWLTPLPDDCFLLTNTLRHCALGINVASTISLELCMFDKPVINVGYNPPHTPVNVPWSRYYDFDHYRPVVESGAISVAYSPEELQRCLVAALRRPGVGTDLRRALTRKMFGPTLDGRTAGRIAAQISQLARMGN